MSGGTGCPGHPGLVHKQLAAVGRASATKLGGRTNGPCAPLPAPSSLGAHDNVLGVKAAAHMRVCVCTCSCRKTPAPAAGGDGSCMLTHTCMCTHNSVRKPPVHQKGNTQVLLSAACEQAWRQPGEMEMEVLRNLRASWAEDRGARAHTHTHAHTQSRGGPGLLFFPLEPSTPALQALPRGASHLS